MLLHTSYVLLYTKQQIHFYESKFLLSISFMRWNNHSLLRHFIICRAMTMQKFRPSLLMNMNVAKLVIFSFCLDREINSRNCKYSIFIRNEQNFAGFIRSFSCLIFIIIRYFCKTLKRLDFKYFIILKFQKNIGNILKMKWMGNLRFLLLINLYLKYSSKDIRKLSRI